MPACPWRAQGWNHHCVLQEAGPGPVLPWLSLSGQVGCVLPPWNSWSVGVCSLPFSLAHREVESIENSEGTDAVGQVHPGRASQ